MASDRMMEYYYSMGQDSYRFGDWDTAVSYFKKATISGASEGAYEICVIGHRWETGDGTDKDEERAMRCYEFAAEHGIDEAELSLGKLYLQGVNGGKPLPRKAKKVLERACDRGDAEAASLLGKLYDEGVMGKVNPKKAFSYYLLAAERGNGGAMLMVGLFYAQGQCLPKDMAAAEMWIRKGRASGDEDGDAVLRGFLSAACREYVSGDAGRKDDGKALAMAKEARLMGDADALYRLGCAFAKRRSDGEDEKKAFACFRQAEKDGPSPEVWLELGRCYDEGVGTRMNRPKGAAYFRKAAEAGLSEGMLCYAKSLEKGRGTERNETAAMEWYIRAAMKGNASAVETLKTVYQYTF